MTTVSTDAIYQQLRTRLLNYADPDGNTLVSAIAQRLYRVGAVDSAVYPYAVMKLKGPQNRPDTDGLVLMADLEVMFFGRPRAMQAAIEALGDRAVSALMTYRDASSGLVWFTSATSESLPMFSAPADADLVQVRVVGKLQCYPTLLSRLSS